VTEDAAVTDFIAVEVRHLVEQARLLLAGRQPAVQSAVLADLLAIYLAGHIIPGAPLDTTALRKELLEAHLDLVRRLIPVNAASIHGQS
jgi:hypothetical protein